MKSLEMFFTDCSTAIFIFRQARFDYLSSRAEIA